MDDRKLLRLSDDVHLLAAPFRLVADLLQAAIFLALFPLVILIAVGHALWVGGPIMDDDAWFFTKVLFCVLAPFAAAIIAGVCSKGSLAKAWAKEFIVLILSFAVVAGFLRFGVITFNDHDHAPAIWTNRDYDYDDVYKGGSPFKIGRMKTGNSSCRLTKSNTCAAIAVTSRMLPIRHPACTHSIV